MITQLRSHRGCLTSMCLNYHFSLLVSALLQKCLNFLSIIPVLQPHKAQHIRESDTGKFILKWYPANCTIQELIDKQLRCAAELGRNLEAVTASIHHTRPNCPACQLVLKTQHLFAACFPYNVEKANMRV